MKQSLKQTYFAKKSEIKKDWIVIDATDLVLGRLASEIAKILKGKHKVTYTPHLDCGDNVIVINAADIYLTGNKFDNKIYYHHTGYPGGIKKRIAGEILESKYPERVLHLAVKRMLKQGPLRNLILKNLYIYPRKDHPHAAQKPTIYNYAEKNPKNIKR